MPKHLHLQAGSGRLLSCAAASLVLAALLVGCAAQQAEPGTTAANVNTSHAAIGQAQIRRQPLSENLVELAYSPSRHALYVAAPDWQDGARSQVLEVNPDTLQVVRAFGTAVKGFGVTLDDTGARLFLSEGDDGSISALDLASGQIVGRVQLVRKASFEQVWRQHGMQGRQLDFFLTQMGRFDRKEGMPWKLRELVFDPRHQRIFAPGLGVGLDSVLYVVDARTMRLEKTISGLGFNASGITLDAAGERVFVANMQGQIKEVSTRTMAVTRTLEVQADQLLNIAYDAASNLIWGVDQGYDRDQWRNALLQQDYRKRSPGRQLFAIDADSGRTVASLPTGEMPVTLWLAPERQRVYVTNRGGAHAEIGHGSISVYDMANRRLLQQLDIWPHPNSLALNPKTGDLFITVKNDQQNRREGQLEAIARIRLQPGQ